MAKNSKSIIKILAVTSLILFARCANQLQPGGGEVDTVPPQIIEVYPGNGTANYHEDYFEISFSEYVDKRSVQEAIFISPALQKPLKYDWSGKTLTVYFNDTLKVNTTYTVSIGTDVKDVNNGNKMAESLTFAFSTGDKIDNGKISGKIYDTSPEGVMIFAYQANSKEADPTKQKPDYVSQVGKKGNYSLPGLRDGNYSIFAIRDKFRDLLYQKNEDGLGVQNKKVELIDKTIEYENVDFFLTFEDTIAPKISNVFMKDRNHIQIEFNEPVDSSKISGDNFVLFDSTANKKIILKYFFKGEGRPNQFYAAFTDTLERKESWVLISKNIPDLKNNLSSEEKNSFAVKNDRDTLALRIIKSAGLLPGEKVDYEEPFVLINFNDAVELSTVKERLSIQDAKGKKILLDVERADDASFLVRLSEKLKQSTDYTLKLDLKNYSDLSGNKIDSLFQNKFSTSNELDFSGVSGTVALNDSTQTFVVLEAAEMVKRIYKQKTDSKKNFDFKKVIPGKYLAWSFKDKNKNGKYDFGTISPFKLSEEFKFYPDTLNLRARWPIGGVNIDFQK
ncbi:MAG: Ig-like domain-containing protein [Ignavibacteriales bacterium]|nr:Ig-like domain-containing protein [Ignavibacteriales bacterium]